MSNSTVHIECEYRTRRHDGTAICIWDGREREDIIRGGKIELPTWIPVKLIEDYSSEKGGDLLDFNKGDKVTLEIPEWLAIEKGLI